MKHACVCCGGETLSAYSHNENEAVTSAAAKALLLLFEGFWFSVLRWEKSHTVSTSHLLQHRTRSARIGVIVKNPKQFGDATRESAFCASCLSFDVFVCDLFDCSSAEWERRAGNYRRCASGSPCIATVTSHAGGNMYTRFWQFPILIAHSSASNWAWWNSPASLFDRHFMSTQVHRSRKWI